MFSGSGGVAHIETARPDLPNAGVAQALIPPFNQFLRVPYKVLAIETPSEFTYASGSGSTVRAWNWRNGKSRRAFKGHTGPVTSIALDYPAGLLYTGSWDQRIGVWDLKTGDNVKYVAEHLDFVKALAVFPEHKRLVSGDAKGVMKVWDTETMTVVQTIYHHSRSVDSIIRLGSSDLFCSASSDRAVCVWRLGAEAPEVSLPVSDDIAKNMAGHLTGVLDLVYDEGTGLLYTACADRFVRCWRLPQTSDGQAVMQWVSPHTLNTGVTAQVGTKYEEAAHDRILPVLSDWPLSIALSADRAHMVCGLRDGRVTVLDNSDGSVVGSVKPHKDGIASIECVSMLDSGDKDVPQSEQTPVECVVTGSWDFSLRRRRLGDLLAEIKGVDREEGEGEGEDSFEDTDDMLDDPEVAEMQRERLRAMLGM
ncbi:hypothetical protein KIPB_001538 [Kipferlia bialata]|uniref:Uncharacterized protein n=1 Tax=Kipferlia bialata TaxID=797122 RepID=A0A9K3GFM0_9EUKA|nr:hypothetical protein KIPB_001538 [Kipferlia bialata]|eukprot:g1538.t1